MAIFARGFIEVEDDTGATQLVQVSKIRQVVDLKGSIGAGVAKSRVVLEKKGQQAVTVIDVTDDIQTIGILINRSKG
jgi:hypothetical protein